MPRAQGFGILPTPDPTIASCISDEDVALGLKRLSDASNISGGRSLPSPLDETLGGRAETISSAASDSEKEEEEEDEEEGFEQPSLPIQQPYNKLEGGKAAQQSMSRKHQKIHNV